jgi:hypothetical protein
MAGTLCILPVLFTQGTWLPEIASRAKGPAVADFTWRLLGALFPQPLEAITEMVPSLVPAVTVIEVVPCPAVIVQPEGTAQA